MSTNEAAVAADVRSVDNDLQLSNATKFWNHLWMNVGGALVYDTCTDDVPVPLTDAPSPHQNAANFAPRVGLLYGFTPEI